MQLEPNVKHYEHIYNTIAEDNVAEQMLDYIVGTQYNCAMIKDKSVSAQSTIVLGVGLRCES